MDYEIVTWRVVCLSCGAPLRLRFIKVADSEEDADYACEQVFAVCGHLVPDDLAEQAIAESDQEFSEAFERGGKTGEIWAAPTPNPDVPPDDPNVG